MNRLTFFFKIRAGNLVREIEVLNINKLENILVDLFGQDESFKKLGE